MPEFMSEKTALVHNLELDYEGIFDLKDFLKAIDHYCKERGYSKGEKRRTEKTTPSGRELSIELRPTKPKTEYYLLIVKIRLDITNLKDVEVLVGKRKTKLSKGKVSAVFDAWITTSYRYIWEQKPYFYFFRALFQKFIKRPVSDKWENELVKDTHFIYNNLKAHLNLYKFSSS